MKTVKKFSFTLTHSTWFDCHDQEATTAKRMLQSIFIGPGLQHFRCRGINVPSGRGRTAPLSHRRTRRHENPSFLATKHLPIRIPLNVNPDTLKHLLQFQWIVGQRLGLRVAAADSGMNLFDLETFVSFAQPQSAERSDPHPHSSPPII